MKSATDEVNSLTDRQNSVKESIENKRNKYDYVLHYCVIIFKNPIRAGSNTKPL